MSATQHSSLDALIGQIGALPDAWHGAGSVSENVLRAFVRHAEAAGPVRSSLETGTGRTTLLLSHLSDRHVVFTKDDTDGGDSYPSVTASPLLRKDHVEFVIGSTQRTLRDHKFTECLDLAFIDGPHAYPFPDLEYWAIYPHVRSGGLLVIDDIQIPTIANLHRFLAADAMWRQLEVIENAAFFQRTDAPAIDPYGEGWWLQGFNAPQSDRGVDERGASHRPPDPWPTRGRVKAGPLDQRTRLFIDDPPGGSIVSDAVWVRGWALVGGLPILPTVRLGEDPVRCALWPDWRPDVAALVGGDDHEPHGYVGWLDLTEAPAGPLVLTVRAGSAEHELRVEHRPGGVRMIVERPRVRAMRRAIRRVLSRGPGT
jgi:hypothetical protein